MLCSLSDVKSWLGITDSTQDTKLTQLIQGVDDQVKSYCNRQFEESTIVLRTLCEDDDQLVLDETPVSAILYAGIGETTALTLSKSGNVSVSVSHDGTNTVVQLVESMAATSITVAVTDTLQDLATNIIAEGWSCTVATGYEGFPAVALLEQQSDYEDDDDDIILSGCYVPIHMLKTTAPGLYMFPGVTGPMCVVYTGGYAAGSLPKGLVLEAIKVCVDAWANMGANGAMKSETIGDYSYTRMDGAIAGAIGAHSQALDMWRRV